MKTAAVSGIAKATKAAHSAAMPMAKMRAAR